MRHELTSAWQFLTPVPAKALTGWIIDYNYGSKEYGVLFDTGARRRLLFDAPTWTCNPLPATTLVVAHPLVPTVCLLRPPRRLRAVPRLARWSSLALSCGSFF